MAFRPPSIHYPVETLMNDEEKYRFDLNGFLVIQGMLGPAELKQGHEAVRELEAHARTNVDRPPQHRGHYGIRYHLNPEYGYCAYISGEGADGSDNRGQLIIDDAFNFSPALLPFVGIDRLMPYLRATMIEPFRLTSFEVRIRYPGNWTPTHMGSLIDLRNRYVFHGRTVMNCQTARLEHRDFELTVLRVMYALEDIGAADGPLCFVPGSHKANFPSPYAGRPEEEPFMAPILMKAGDAVVFTENVRHGGYTITGPKPRRTIHAAYQPSWSGSMSPVHWNSPVRVHRHIVPALSENQRYLLDGAIIVGG